MNYNTRQEFHQDNEFILATIKKRFVAFLIDWIVLILIYLCIIILFAFQYEHFEYKCTWYFRC